MKNVMLSTTAIFMLTASAVVAGGGNSDAAKGLAETVSSDPGIAGETAPTVSGKDQRGDSGWGNAAGVSKSGKPSDN